MIKISQRDMVIGGVCIFIGVLIMGIPIMKSGGGFVSKLEETNKEMKRLKAQLAFEKAGMIPKPNKDMQRQIWDLEWELEFLRDRINKSSCEK